MPTVYMATFQCRVNPVLQTNGANRDIARKPLRGLPLGLACSELAVGALLDPQPTTLRHSDLAEAFFKLTIFSSRRNGRAIQKLNETECSVNAQSFDFAPLHWLHIDQRSTPLRIRNILESRFVGEPRILTVEKRLIQEDVQFCFEGLTLRMT